MENLEETIAHHLCKDNSYRSFLLPFIGENYFENQDISVIVDIIKNFCEKNYTTSFSIPAINIELDKLELQKSEDERIRSLIKKFEKKPIEADRDWLIEETEEYFKKRALYNAISKSIEIYEQDEKEYGKIKELIENAISLEFKSDVGVEYDDTFEQRYHYYTQEDEFRIIFEEDRLNQITGGGLPRKTLNVIIAGTNVGKTAWMCSTSCEFLRKGYNVLYITNEMSENEIAKRIDANVLDIEMSSLKMLDETTYFNRVKKKKDLMVGKLFIKEYPNGTASILHFQNLLKELKNKKRFKPDVVFVDYINICASARIKMSKSSSYEYVKSIAEELRAFAIQNNVAVVSATQFNRDGIKSSDPGVSESADSMGLPFTADFMLGLLTNDELRARGKVQAKVIKTRYNAQDSFRISLFTFDNKKMRFFYDGDDKNGSVQLVNFDEEEKEAEHRHANGFSFIKDG